MTLFTGSLRPQPSLRYLLLIAQPQPLPWMVVHQLEAFLTVFVDKIVFAIIVIFSVLIALIVLLVLIVLLSLTVLYVLVLLVVIFTRGLNAQTHFRIFIAK